MFFFKNISLFPLGKNPLVIVIDVLIVSVLIYQFYTTIRRTRGIQLLLGVALIWLLGIFASYFELELLDWIIENIRPALVFAIIVLLQPELRKITADLSRMKIFQPFLLKQTTDLEAISEAVKIMAKNKTGSLIAIVRENSLKDIIDQSVQLDAIISTSLLITIFKKNSALHDGAVIIEQNRIACAGAFLPMTQNLDDARMGARHRAAIGISEESDSIVIVTSEETGEISVCYDGEMTHPVKPIELKNFVNTILQKRETGSEKHNATASSSEEKTGEHR
ncbi:TIGR00159 family protein [Leptospira yasudae]|uniref:Diadenylate cyclase n=1 Tax=Leptospira yasudae TaxID=2202201 RepID=A0ABX9M5B2_9LEPT|nr:diadenylate cyclase CdaA [Leptospira yasudae]MBW0433941.1 TIGR00159 family protein [Leptospira yasudae]RHX80931.1 TIGR00159 family protein [Leptospira yasudae]RHX94728.1 TIGR00159 family protein [Leptospira yasudae]TGK24908.1 TIGR00159 family protein [Leptospira yasudae]TGM05930.1 TIGR00159 family protein [Leptospira yasudae]